jgi:hypothetical protein
MPIVFLRAHTQKKRLKSKRLVKYVLKEIVAVK